MQQCNNFRFLLFSWIVERHRSCLVLTSSYSFPPLPPLLLQVTDLDFWLSNAPVPSNTQVESVSLSLSFSLSLTRLLLSSFGSSTLLSWAYCNSIKTLCYFFVFPPLITPWFQSCSAHVFRPGPSFTGHTAHRTSLPFSHSPASLSFLACCCVCVCLDLSH